MESYVQELDLAIRAVRLACTATKVLRASKSLESIDKTDASPVTVADFAAQAVLIWAIHHVFSQDSFVAEESSELLRENPHLTEQTWQLIRSSDKQGDNPHSLRLPESCNDVISALDLQKFLPSQTRLPRDEFGSWTQLMLRKLSSLGDNMEFVWLWSSTAFRKLVLSVAQLLPSYIELIKYHIKPPYIRRLPVIVLGAIIYRLDSTLLKVVRVLTNSFSIYY